MKKSKIQIFNELRNEVYRISKKINDTRSVYLSGRLSRVRKHLSLALKDNTKCPVNDRINILLEGLQSAERELDKSRREFHSKFVKSVREEIDEILDKYACEINN